MPRHFYGPRRRWIRLRERDTGASLRQHFLLPMHCISLKLDGMGQKGSMAQNRIGIERICSLSWVLLYAMQCTPRAVKGFP
jgi:hypothetical protein